VDKAGYFCKKPGILASINTGLDWQIGQVLVVLRKNGHFSENDRLFQKMPGHNTFSFVFI
jgi:hypothetical protein